MELFGLTRKKGEIESTKIGVNLEQEAPALADETRFKPKTSEDYLAEIHAEQERLMRGPEEVTDDCLRDPSVSRQCGAI